MKFYKIQEWDYMDSNPSVHVYAFENDGKAKELADYMQNNYSGGTTKYLGAMDSVEAANYVRHLYNIEKSNPQEDSHDYLLDIALKYKECYGGNVISAEELIAFP